MSEQGITQSDTSPLVVAGFEDALKRLVQRVQTQECPSFDAVPLDHEGRPNGGSPHLADVLWVGGGSPSGGIRWRPSESVRRAIEALPSLRWVHTDSVGIDHLPLVELRQRGIVVTNGGDNFARPMAEWVVLAMLAAVKNLPAFVRYSDDGYWARGLFQDELQGKVALMLGLGSFAQVAAKLLEPFGVEVVALVRNPRSPGAVHSVRLVHGDRWRDELPRTDFLVAGLPLTPSTEGIVDTEVLGALHPAAWLINFARGKLVGQAELITALDAGTIGGAVLDAFPEEPLRSGHSLWGRPNVLVLPHSTWFSPHVGERAERRFVAQLWRWVKKEPLVGSRDLEAGY